MVGPYQELISHFFCKPLRGQGCKHWSRENSTLALNLNPWPRMEFVFSRSIRKIRANFLPFLIPIISSGFAPILFSLLHCLRKNTFAYFSLASSAFLCNQLRPLFHEIEISHHALYAVLFVWYVMRQPWIIEQMRKQPLAGWVGLFTFFSLMNTFRRSCANKGFFSSFQSSKAFVGTMYLEQTSEIL